MEILPIAHFVSPFGSKFGIPKQSGLVKELEGDVVFEPAYRDVDALRGIEGFDYLWLLWGFSANKHQPDSLMVRPPLLGGNEKVGVFASRSPFRPNALGLSSVRLLRVDRHETLGSVLHVGGADLMDGTPIYDIKPYVTFTDCHPEARSGFVDTHDLKLLQVEIPPSVAAHYSQQQLEALRKVLALDPRPHYQADPDKVYGMPYLGHDIHFRVEGDVLKVVDDD